jgi:hypothetical protein
MAMSPSNPERNSLADPAHARQKLRRSGRRCAGQDGGTTAFDGLEEFVSEHPALEAVR